MDDRMLMNKKGLAQPRQMRKTIIVFVIGIVLTNLLCLAALISFFGIRAFTIDFMDTGAFTLPSIAGETKTPKLNPQGTPLPPDNLALEGGNLPGADLTPWDGAERVTVLLLGLDYRDWSSNEGLSRSDTMMLVTLDPTTKTAGMLSIPRDLWVSIPGFQHGKINTAYYLGDAYQLPGGGPALAVKTVEAFLGVPIQYYAQIDFSAFVRFIDEIGGVKIDIPEAITIDLLGSGSATKKTLQPGRQVLPGEWALAYARARYTGGGDFDRAKRQQQVILAIRDKILSLDLLPTLVAKAPDLYQELSSGVRTNLALDEIIKLAVLAQTVPEEHIKRGVIDKGDVFFGFSPDGLSILIPIPDDIYRLRDEIFASEGSLAPKTSGNLQEKMISENAKLAIYNGSQTNGLENRTADYLSAQGCQIIQVSTAAEIYASTTIIDHTGNPYLLSYLVDLLAIHPSKIYIKFDPQSQADVELFLGNDWAQNNRLP